MGARRVESRKEPVHVLYSIAIGSSVRGWHRLSRREVICIGGPDVDHGFEEIVFVVRQSWERGRGRSWQAVASSSIRSSEINIRLSHKFDKAAFRSGLPWHL